MADVNGEIIRGLQRRIPGIDLLRIQDVLPEGSPDSDVLDWCDQAGRVMITNDRNTMVGLAFERAATGRATPGIIATTNEQAVGSAIDDIHLIAECMTEDEISIRVVVYLPFRA